VQACLAWVEVVSPFGGWGSTLALLFVLVVAAVKAFWEDVKRHQEDHSTNASVAHIVNADGARPASSLRVGCMPGGGPQRAGGERLSCNFSTHMLPICTAERHARGCSVTSDQWAPSRGRALALTRAAPARRAAGSSRDIAWRDVRVGQVLRVQDDELFPADLLCLHSALPDKACFIKTTNLDGASQQTLHPDPTQLAAHRAGCEWPGCRGASRGGPQRLPQRAVPSGGGPHPAVHAGRRAAGPGARACAQASPTLRCASRWTCARTRRRRRPR